MCIKDYDNDFYYSYDNIFIISKDIQNPDYQLYNNILYESRKRVFDELKIQSEFLCPIMILSNNSDKSIIDYFMGEGVYGAYTCTPDTYFITILHNHFNIDTLSHELTHAILHANLGNVAYYNLPLWLNEGLACQFGYEQYLHNPLYEDELKYISPDDIFNIEHNYTDPNASDYALYESYSIHYILISEWLNFNNDPLLIKEMIEKLSDKTHMNRNIDFSKYQDFKDFFMSHKGDKAIANVIERMSKQILSPTMNTDPEDNTPYYIKNSDRINWSDLSEDAPDTLYESTRNYDDFYFEN